MFNPHNPGVSFDILESEYDGVEPKRMRDLQAPTRLIHQGLPEIVVPPAEKLPSVCTEPDCKKTLHPATFVRIPINNGGWDGFFCSWTCAEAVVGESWMSELKEQDAAWNPLKSHCQWCDRETNFVCPAPQCSTPTCFNCRIQCDSKNCRKQGCRSDVCPFWDPEVGSEVPSYHKCKRTNGYAECASDHLCSQCYDDAHAAAY